MLKCANINKKMFDFFKKLCGKKEEAQNTAPAEEPKVEVEQKPSEPEIQSENPEPQQPQSQENGDNSKIW